MHTYNKKIDRHNADVCICIHTQYTRYINTYIVYGVRVCVAQQVNKSHTLHCFRYKSRNQLLNSLYSWNIMLYIRVIFSCCWFAQWLSFQKKRKYRLYRKKIIFASYDKLCSSFSKRQKHLFEDELYKLIC